MHGGGGGAPTDFADVEADAHACVVGRRTALPGGAADASFGLGPARLAGLLSRPLGAGAVAAAVASVVTTASPIIPAIYEDAWLVESPAVVVGASRRARRARRALPSTASVLAAVTAVRGAPARATLHPPPADRAAVRAALACACLENAALAGVGLDCAEEEEGALPVALAQTGPHAARRPTPISPTTPPPSSSSWLISGGLGGLGRLTAGWLVEAAAGRTLALALVGRDGRRGGAALAGLSAATPNLLIRAAAADTASAADAAGLGTGFLWADDSFRHLTGLILAGGVLADGTAAGLTPAAVRAAAAPKMGAARALTRWCAPAATPLRAGHVFGSASAALGNPGQAAYAAANAGVGAWAARAGEAGVPMSAAAWGAWGGGGGMAAAVAARLARAGFLPLAPVDGLRALGDIMAASACVGPVGMFAWDAILGRARLLLPPVPPSPQKGSSPSPLSSDALLDTVLSTLRRVVGADVPPTTPLMQAGLDSLGTLELRDALAAATGLGGLPPTLAFDHPTPLALAAELAERLAKIHGGEDAVVVVKKAAAEVDMLSPAIPTTAPPPARVVRVVAAAGHFPPAPPPPAGSPHHPRVPGTGLASFWAALAGGVSLQAPTPLDRWDVDAAYDPDGGATTVSVRLAAWAPSFDALDPAALGLAPPDAVALDPQARRLLELAGEVLHGAGADAPPHSKTGTFVGCMFWDAADVARRAYGSPATGPLMTGVGAPYLAGRAAFTYDLAGPCHGVDTACSSSLVAAHAGRAAVAGGECGGALVGGVNAMLWVGTTAGICALQALSRSGRCRTFDAAADGYGRGEGFGVVLLASGGDSGGGGRAPLALLAGSAVNQDGRSASLIAPSGPAQRTLVAAALASGGLAASAVASVIVHGTGTPLGDPIEVGALAGALGGDGGGSGSAAPHAPPSLASVKATYGHTEGAAGVKGLLAALASLRDRLTPPVTGLRGLNPYVGAAVGEWSGGSGGGAALPRAPGAAPGLGSATPVAVGTSSFGMSGVNAHALLVPADKPDHAPSTLSPPLPWRRGRHWHGPHLHRLAHPDGAAPLTFTAPLDAPPGLAFLRDHVVRGRVLLPAAAMVEAGAAVCGQLLAGAAAAAVAPMSAALTGAAFLSPVVLGRPGDPASFKLVVDPDSGSLTIGTVSGGVAARASLAAVAAAEPPFGTDAPRAPLRLLGALRRPSYPSPPPALATAALARPPAPADGWYAHPAAVDAALHLEAARTADTTTTARVPVALGAAALRPAAAGTRVEVAGGGSGAWAAASPAPGTAAAADITMQSGTPPIRWAGLVSQAAGPAAAVVGPAPHQPAPQPRALAVAWQVCEVAPTAVSAPAAPGRRLLRLNARANPVTAAAAALRGVFGGGGSGPLQVEGHAATACAAAAGAALRTAASEGEAPGAAWSLTSPWEVRAVRRPAPGGSEFGIASSGRAVARPALLEARLGGGGARPRLPLSPATPTLIIGGMGGLGRLVAGWLEAGGGGGNVPNNGRLLLVGRSARGTRAPPPASPLLTTLAAADAGTAAGAAFAHALTGRRLCTLMLAGGARQDGLARSQGVTALRLAGGAKAAAAAALARSAAPAPPPLTLAFSSVAGLLGSAGQAGYAAANAALDAWCESAAGTGLGAVSAQWGAWAGAGMAAGEPGLLARLRRAGHGALEPATALGALERLMESPQQPAIAIAAVDWAALVRGRGEGGGFFAALVADAQQAAAGPPPASAAPQRRPTSPLSPAPPPPSTTTLTAVLDAIEATLGARPPPEAPLALAAGLDSLGAVELRDALAARFGLALPATIALEAGTAAALTAALDGRLARAGGSGSVVRAAAPVPVPRPTPPPPSASSAPTPPLLAITAAAARLPGPALATTPSLAQAASAFSSWSATATDAVSPLPTSRWDADAHAAAGARLPIYARLAATLPGSRSFDAAAFAMPPEEAVNADPHARLLLELGAEALTAAGGDAWSGGGRQHAGRAPVATFVGCMWASDFGSGDAAGLTSGLDDLAPASITSNGPAFLAGRVAYALGLAGPTAAVDTACSSSLVAAHLAAGALCPGRGGEGPPPPPPPPPLSPPWSRASTCSCPPGRPPRSAAWPLWPRTGGARPWTRPRTGTGGARPGARWWWRRRSGADHPARASWPCWPPQPSTRVDERPR